MLGEGAGRPCPRLANASLHAPFSRARLSHRQNPHVRAPSSHARHAQPQAALMQHRSNSRSYGAGGRAARWEKENGAACQPTARRATRKRPLTSAIDAPQSVPHANILVEHGGVSTCGVQHSGEHCVAVWLSVAVGAAHRSQNAEMAAEICPTRRCLAAAHAAAAWAASWQCHARRPQIGCVRCREAPLPRPRPSKPRRE